MTGIFLFIIGLIWLAVVIGLAIVVVWRLKHPVVRTGVGLLVCAVLLPLPVADEIVAERQFNEICREGAVLRIDAQRIKGRKIKLAFEPANAPVPNIAVPATYTRVIFRDAATSEELGSYGRYVAKGGVLIRALGISESNSPVWMSRSYCSPDAGSKQMAAQYGFEAVN